MRPRVMGVINGVKRKSVVKVGIYECEPGKPREGVKVSGYIYGLKVTAHDHMHEVHIYQMMVMMMMMTCNAKQRNAIYLFRFMI